MNKTIALTLLKNFIERYGNPEQGILTPLELEAFHFLIADDNSSDDKPISSHDKPTPPPIIKENTSPDDRTSYIDIPLNMNSLYYKEKNADDILMCLDFGTAFSKACVRQNRNLIDLPLGETAGDTGYILPSSVYISNDRKIYVGSKAIEISGDQDEKTARIDSMKAYISLQNNLSLERSVPESQNPFYQECALTQKDILVFYLAYLTDITGICLQNKNFSRYTKRRFSHPCWQKDKYTWACDTMKTMLAQSLILADTFSGQWDNGIDIHLFKKLINEIKKKNSDELPLHIIAEAVAEPVAVASPIFDLTENRRDVLMVIDVGAGTTDFGLFLCTSDSDGKPHVHVLHDSIESFNQAGDAVDRLLQNYIIKKESLSGTDTYSDIIKISLNKKIREYKELLFKDEFVEYVLADNKSGTVYIDDFVNHQQFQNLSQGIRNRFLSIFKRIDKSWLKFLAQQGNRVNVLLTGGSSGLPIFRELQNEIVEVSNENIPLKIKCVPYNIQKTEFWDSIPESLIDVYSQLAVALGGTSRDLPKEMSEAPKTAPFGATRLQLEKY